jgi:drug/metabolite transporter (DMT)-like permease
VGDLHSVWGYAAISVCGVTGLYGVLLAATRRSPSRPFWIGVGAGIGAMVVQVVLGLAAMSLEDTDPGNQHVFYGVVIAFTLAFAYIYRSQLRKRPALYYGLLMLFVMGLGIRGITTFGKSF